MANSVNGSLQSGLLDQWEYAVLYLAASVIISGVVINFVDYRRTERVKVAEQHMLVATFFMVLFFLAVFLVARFGVGRLSMTPPLAWVAKASGSVMVLFAATINIAGRVALGRHWSNQIEIIQGHQLVRAWPYTWARHPLYGSLVIFGVGMGVLTRNPLVVVATLVLFLPAVRKRAGNEELLLTRALGDEYRAYQDQVPMLLPRLPEWLSRIARGLVAGLLVWSAWTQTLDVFVFTALPVLCLSFVMERSDFRLAYKLKPLVIILCAGLAWRFPSLALLLWLPAVSAVISLFGHCPGTLMVGVIERRRHRGGYS
jgi:protein-S-isoprenylcysteine O-methyltransferase Ste14